MQRQNNECNQLESADGNKRFTWQLQTGGHQISNENIERKIYWFIYRQLLHKRKQNFFESHPSKHLKNNYFNLNLCNLTMLYRFKKCYSESNWVFLMKLLIHASTSAYKKFLKGNFNLTDFKSIIKKMLIK